MTILLKKIAIICGKGEFSKFNGKIFNVPMEAEVYAIVFPRPVVFNGLMVIKLKWDLKYRVHAHFDPLAHIFTKRSHI